MAPPFGTRDVKNEPFRPTRVNPSNPNNSGVRSDRPFTLDQDIREAIRKTQNERLFRDWVKNRPLRQYRPPSVPVLPYRVEKTLMRKAFDLAVRMVVNGTKLHPFRLLLQWLFEWLLKWATKWLLRSRGGRPWTIRAECGSKHPLPIAADFYATMTSNYPPTATQLGQANGCLSSQTVPLSQVVGDLSGVHTLLCGSYQYRPYGMAGTKAYRCQVIGYWARPKVGQELPSVWLPPSQTERPHIDDLPPPPKKVEDVLIPDWKSVIDPDILPPESYEPDPDVPEQAEPHREIDVGPNTKTQVRSEYRFNRRTRSGEKEQKFSGSSETVKRIFKTVGYWKEQLTEADDFIDTVFESLPKEIQKNVVKRGGRLTPDIKMKTIYDHFDKIDWTKWVDNFVQNWLEDKAIGRAIASSDRAAMKRGATNTVSQSRWWLHRAR